MMDDNDTILLATQGDTHAFRKVVEQHYQVIYKMAYKWSGNQMDAEDITQEVCIKLARSITSFNGDSAFTSWLYRIVINTAKDMHKATKRRQHKEETYGKEANSCSYPSPESQLCAQELLQLLDKLPDGQKDALLLVTSEGLSHKEAGNVLDCSEGTISWCVHEARKTLVTLMKDGGMA